MTPYVLIKVVSSFTFKVIIQRYVFIVIVFFVVSFFVEIFFWSFVVFVTFGLLCTKKIPFNIFCRSPVHRTWHFSILFVAHPLQLCLSHFYFHCRCLHWLCLLWSVLVLCGVSGTQAGQLWGGVLVGEHGSEAAVLQYLCWATSPMLAPQKWCNG